MRFDLIRTCLCAAPSVTACAAPPSSGRKALVFRTNHLVSPSGRDVAQRQRGLAPSSRELDLPQAKTEGVLQIWQNTHEICPNTNLPACCPLSHLLRKCQLSQRESREAGANCTPDESGKLSCRPVSVLLLPSRLAPCHLPQRGRLFLLLLCCQCVGDAG